VDELQTPGLMTGIPRAEELHSEFSYSSLLYAAYIIISTSYQHIGTPVGLIPIHLPCIAILCQTLLLCFLLEFFSTLAGKSRKYNVVP